MGERTDQRPLPGPGELRELAEGLIREQNTVTLATARQDAAWAAPVYYANLSFDLYFFSDPGSRHIREALESSGASGAVFVPASTWREIRGVQLSGRITPVTPGIDAIRALRAYLKKFPFTSDFFDSDGPPDLEDFVKRFRVRFYRLRPELLYYTDNRIHFSFRAQVPL